LVVWMSCVCLLAAVPVPLSEGDGLAVGADRQLLSLSRWDRCRGHCTDLDSIWKTRFNCISGRLPDVIHMPDVVGRRECTSHAVIDLCVCTVPMNAHMSWRTHRYTAPIDQPASQPVSHSTLTKQTASHPIPHQEPLLQANCNSLHTQRLVEVRVHPSMHPSLVEGWRGQRRGALVASTTLTHT